MRAWQDGENEVTHPLKKFVLLEYEEALAESCREPPAHHSAT